MKAPVTANTVAEIARFVARGHSQSASNCRVLISAMNEARAERNEARNIIRDLLGLCGNADRYIGDAEKVARARTFLGEVAA